MASKGQPDYAIDLQPMAGGVLVAMGGELDVAAAPYLRERLARAVDHEPQTVRIDLSEVSFLDSMAVGMLISVKRRVDSYGGFFSTRCGPRTLLALGIRGLIDYLNVDSAG